MKHPMWDEQPAVTQLLPEEQQQLLGLLKKVGWQRTGKDIFEAIMFAIFPAVPSECAIVRTINHEPHVLMWFRDDDYTGHHMPGKYILRGEDDEAWVKRTIASETGLKLVNFEFIRRFSTRPETGWVPGQQMNHFWYCEVEGEPTNGTFYPLTAIPDDTLGHHRKYVDCLRAFLLRREGMRKGLIRFDGLHRASEWRWLAQIYDELRGKNWFCEFASFDEALAQNPTCLYDDQGQQIM